MLENFFLIWTVTHLMVLGIGFGVGLAAGLKIPIVGDAIAMLLVGLLLMLSEFYILNAHIDTSTDWLLYSFIGLILGVGASFVFILITTHRFGLKNSHIFSFPISLLVIATFQTLVLRDQFDNLLMWPFISMLSLVIASLILYIINNKYNLAMRLLADRKPEYNKIPIWIFTGSVLGLIYGMITGYFLTKK